MNEYVSSWQETCPDQGIRMLRMAERTGPGRDANRIDEAQTFGTRLASGGRCNKQHRGEKDVKRS
jgi:hypothetical protein